MTAPASLLVSAKSVSSAREKRPLLEVRGLRTSFYTRAGVIRAVTGVDFSVSRNEIVGLVGESGCGKSVTSLSILRLISSPGRIEAGEVIFDGQDVTGLRPHELFHRGMLRTFQIAHEFSNMTALENLMMVPAGQPGESLIRTWLMPGVVKEAERHVRQKALDVIDFLKLGHVKNELAGNLSGGQKKLLELGRTMMVDAKVVLLDEVAAGVNRTLLQDLAANIERMNQELGYTFFVIEHDMDLIGRLCDPVIVMAQGEKIAEGPMAEIRANPAIIEAYFGSPVAA